MNVAIDAVRAVSEHAPRILDYGRFFDPLPEIPHGVQHDALAVVALAVEGEPDCAGPDLLYFGDAADEDLGRIAEIDGFRVLHDDGFPSPTPPQRLPKCGNNCGDMEPLWPFPATDCNQSVIFRHVSRENPWVVYHRVWFCSVRCKSISAGDLAAQRGRLFSQSAAIFNSTDVSAGKRTPVPTGNSTSADRRRHQCYTLGAAAIFICLRQNASRDILSLCIQCTLQLWRIEIVKRDEFIEQTRDIIENVVMSVQGFAEVYTTLEAAMDVAVLLPLYVWSEDL